MMGERERERERSWGWNIFRRGGICITIFILHQKIEHNWNLSQFSNTNNQNLYLGHFSTFEIRSQMLKSTIKLYKCTKDVKFLKGTLSKSWAKLELNIGIQTSYVVRIHIHHFCIKISNKFSRKLKFNSNT